MVEAIFGANVIPKLSVCNLSIKPEDILNVAKELESEDIDLIQTNRKDRRESDTSLTQAIPELLTRRFISKMTGLKLQDPNCPLRGFKKDIIPFLNLIGSK